MIIKNNWASNNYGKRLVLLGADAGSAPRRIEAILLDTARFVSGFGRGRKLDWCARAKRNEHPWVRKKSEKVRLRLEQRLHKSVLAHGSVQWHKYLRASEWPYLGQDAVYLQQVYRWPIPRLKSRDELIDLQTNELVRFPQPRAAEELGHLDNLDVHRGYQSRWNGQNSCRKERP